MLTRKSEWREVKDYRGWPLRQRLELLAFEARLAEVPPAYRVPPALLEALWEATNLRSCTRPGRRPVNDAR
jgi:hypothetical protein